MVQQAHSTVLVAGLELVAALRPRPAVTEPCRLRPDQAAAAAQGESVRHQNY